MVAISAVAVSGVMGFHMDNMDASAGQGGASASMGGMSVSAGPDGAKADVKDDGMAPETMVGYVFGGIVFLFVVIFIMSHFKLGCFNISEERKQELIAERKYADERRAEKEARENPVVEIVVVSESTQMKMEMERLRLANEELRMQNLDLESQVSSKTSFEKMQERVRAAAAI